MNNPRQCRSWIFGKLGRIAGAVLALAILLVLAVLATGSAQAQTYTYSVLYSFTGSPDGAFPTGGVPDANGDLYGTTYYGGASGYGTVFKVGPTGKETVLHSFTGGGDGAYPFAGLVRDAQSNLYGTTYYGGSCNCGTVFKLDATGKETVLYRFTGSPDGSYSESGLLLDAPGNLYGTTPDGGASGYGTVFKVDPTGKETVVYSFTGGGDGGNPTAALARDPQGNLYGTTRNGGTSG
jgi:uncharacterized repeat protein (TIGR03803 family)